MRRIRFKFLRSARVRNHRMRVLFVHKFFPAQYTHIARALAAGGGNEVAFIHAEGENDDPAIRTVRVKAARAASPGTHHYLQGFETAVLFGQAAYRAAADLARGGFRPDVICAHAGFGPGLYLKDAFPGVPLLGYFEWYYRARDADADYLDPHAVGEDEALRIRTRNAGILLELAGCDRAVCPTAFQRDQFPPELRGKLAVIHDGVDTAGFAPAAAPVALRDVPEDAEIVTYATRGLEPYRGFPQFMEAVALLQTRRPRLHAVVVGADETNYGRPSGDGRGYRDVMLGRLPALDRGRVHFRGFLPQHEYRSVLQASHAHVYLTVPFVLSWSLLDAMATGCAIVGSDTGPVREVIRDGETGLLADMRTPRGIAAAIERLLDDRRLAARLGAAARGHVAEHYALDRLLPRQLELIASLAREKAARKRA
jgi:glycosyltransferase involved in cell wall biosynthesis